MTPLSPLLASPALKALGWALLHFLWQGALLGLLAWAALSLLARRSPEARYAVGAAFLLAMPLAVLATFFILLLGGRAESVATAAAGAAAPVALPLSLRARLVLEPLLPWCVAGWTLGVGLLSLRLAGGLWWLQRLRTLEVSHVPAEWHLVLSRLCRELKLHRTVRLLRSAAVEVPMVIGWLRPVVLLPVSAFTGLAPLQIEAVLAHELAHIRRHDFAMNLAQSLLEALLFYHPAVWWLSARLRAERELCCDDVAVGLCGDALAYARALATLEGLRTEPQALALAANGGPLMSRIKRLLQPNLMPTPRLRGISLALLAVTVLGATTVALKDQVDRKAEVQRLRIVDGDRNLKVESEGKVELKPDAATPVQVPADGRFRLDERKDGSRRSYEVKGGTAVYTVDGQEKPLDAEGRAWVVSAVQRVEKSRKQAAEAEKDAQQAEKDAKEATKDAETARKDAEAARKDMEVHRIEIRKAVREAQREAQREARRTKVEVTEPKPGVQHIVVKKDGMVVEDKTIEVPEVETKEEGPGRQRIIVKKGGQVVEDHLIEIPEIETVDGKDGKRRIIVKKGGKVVQESVIPNEDDLDLNLDLGPDLEFENLPPGSFTWKEGTGKAEKRRFKVLGPKAQREELERLREENRELRRQLAEREGRRTPKAARPPKPSAAPAPPPPPKAPSVPQSMAPPPPPAAAPTPPAPAAPSAPSVE
ncbi:MAG TPA: M56 family metallopeptidase [Holophagaceae bacterium]|nr:M56 family metallopeptidase [Holophagaceae bacterium]